MQYQHLADYVEWVEVPLPLSSPALHTENNNIFKEGCIHYHLYTCTHKEVMQGSRIAAPYSKQQYRLWCITDTVAAHWINPSQSLHSTFFKSEKWLLPASSPVWYSVIGLVVEYVPATDETGVRYHRNQVVSSIDFSRNSPITQIDEILLFFFFDLYRRIV